MSIHLVLFGDSIFDNHAYVQPGEPAVIDQLRGLLPGESRLPCWRSTAPGSPISGANLPTCLATQRI